MNEFGHPITSLPELEAALRDGRIVMKVASPTPELAAAWGDELDAQIAALPAVIEDLRGLVDQVDRYAVMGQVMAWFLEDVEDAPVSHRTWAVLEFMAALTLEHSTRVADGCEGQGLDAPALARLLDGLAKLLASTPEILAGSSVKPNPMWRLAKRFIGSQLNTPIVSTDEQEELLLFEFSTNERLSADLRSTVGFDCADALRFYYGLLKRSVEGMRAWGAETDGQPFHVAGCRLVDYLCFTADDLTSYGVEPQIAAALCEVLALPLGSSVVRLPGLTSALRERPLLIDEQGVLLCVGLPLLLRALRPGLRDSLNPDSGGAKNSKSGFDRWRKQENRVVAKVTEETLQWIGFHETGREAQWATKDDNSDIDVWAYLEGHLLSFQIKAGRRRPWRNIDTFESDLKKLVIDAITQDERFRSAIRRDDFAWKSRDTPPARREDAVTPIVLTLEDVSSCAVVSAQLRKAGLVTGQLPWIISLAHFEQTLELLELPAVLLHFLRRRATLNEDRIAALDEIDLVLEYLSHGLEWAIYEQPPFQGKAVLQLPTYEFRDYQAWLEGERGLGPTVSKPALPLPAGLRTLLHRLEQDRPPNYLQMSISLLDLPRSTWPRIATAWSYINTPTDRQRPVLVADPAFAFSDGSALGFTFLRWDNELQDPDAMTMLLTRYCTVQQHRARAKLWYGLLISDSTPSASAVVVLEADP
jgi:hypothetical protein